MRYLIACCLFLTACGPRGEGPSLAQVLSLSRGRFENAIERPLPLHISAELERIASAASSLSSGTVPKEDRVALADTLQKFIPRAGYTQRPSLGEVVSQLREPTTGHDGDVLLSARVYDILAAELETTRFALDPAS